MYRETNKFGNFLLHCFVISKNICNFDVVKKINQYIATLFSKLGKRYWALSYWPRHIVGFCLVFCVFAGVFGIVYGTYSGVRSLVVYASELLNMGNSSNEIDDGISDKDEYSRPGSNHFSFPLNESERHPKRRPNFRKDFDYINDVHMGAARRLGIRPLANREALQQSKDKLVELHNTRYYKIDPLTSSVPYLVPKAADFLTAVGRLMQEYNGTTSRFIVTSVLRTQADVKSLRRRNGNASENSTHCYATTVDITYNRFDIHGNTWEGKLKEDLAKALYDLQERGYCYVKYEVKQPCFHITVRP